LHVSRLGPLSLDDLAEAGLSEKMIAAWVRDGRLTRLFRGVYTAGPLEPLMRERGALLACGESAVLSHHTAAAVWRIRPALRTIDVTIPRGHRRHQPGLRVHQSPLAPDEITSRHGLRITTPGRTLLDLAGTIPADDLARAANEAQVQGLTTPTELHSYLARCSSRQGVRALRDALGSEPALTRSELERRMLALIDRIGLPRPRTNVRILGYEVDFLWPAQKLIVETDGYAPHQTRRAFERDRSRDARLTAAGYRVLRFTWRQLTEESDIVAARLAAALAR
jgi:very-short-patch-repair endonuclease